MAIHRFVKGVSGNPSGRPKVAFNIVNIAREHTVESIQTLVNLMQSSKDENIKLKAAIALIERGYGKPIQAIEGTLTHTIVEMAKIKRNGSPLELCIG